MTGKPGNVVGVDPHKHTLSATVLDERGGIIGTSHYRVSGDGHRALEAWALSFGAVARWGIEGASGLGRHTSVYLCRQGHDVRDVCPTGPRNAHVDATRGSRTHSTASGSPAKPLLTPTPPSLQAGG